VRPDGVIAILFDVDGTLVTTHQHSILDRIENDS
jgi:FMN phosphatase YigB (HAD superfamily)